ncbi:hypothetical protein L1987_20837 [Smallanthus sonchifolius]|uniref:Uncharacterized protein n=1 Tax=Smallanthus sonchifolius TaxID=185202 RepID=A0ACB9IUE9_9ASTR|nr:hypothetical protein L1987_20837 [Smallanthus sonchifolius]
MKDLLRVQGTKMLVGIKCTMHLCITNSVDLILVETIQMSRMAVTSQEQNDLTDDYPLLIDNHENQHFIDVERENTDASSSPSSSSSSAAALSSGLSDNSPSHGLRENRQGSTTHSGPSNTSRWNPFNTLLWISIELVFTSGQIIAAIVVFFISQSENPQNPLFAWVVGYAGGCAASLPLLYWRYLHRNQATGQRSTQGQQQPRSERITPPEPNSYITISFAPSPDEETHQTTSSNTWTGPNVSGSNIRLNMLVDHFKMALDCFFAVWFVVGNVWIFGDQSSYADAPNLYRLCIVFLAFSCMGYAMPFILCGMICCCLPCIVSILGIREDMNQIRGATEDSINALPTHKFKLNPTTDNNEYDNSGGLLAAGTKNERAVSGEDAVCCICLAKYGDDDLLRELPCTHFFHTECVDRWLKINASCPLCKFEIELQPADQTSQDQNLWSIWSKHSIPRPLYHFSPKLKSHTLKSQKSDISKPQTKKTQDDGIPIDLVKTLAKFKSRHNFIRVLEVSRKSDHPFAGSRLLLLDTPGNIHSIPFLVKLLTGTYFDVFATFPPILPPEPLGILGFGAGSAAKLILELYPQGVVHGWELDPTDISVGREYFGLSKLESQYPDRLFIYVGNVLNANIESGFSGLLVDLFSKGCLIPELQDPDTWMKMMKKLREGGRIMVNVGGVVLKLGIRGGMGRW